MTIARGRIASNSTTGLCFVYNLVQTFRFKNINIIIIGWRSKTQCLFPNIYPRNRNIHLKRPRHQNFNWCAFTIDYGLLWAYWQHIHIRVITTKCKLLYKQVHDMCNNWFIMCGLGSASFVDVYRFSMYIC